MQCEVAHCSANCHLNVINVFVQQLSLRHPDIVFVPLPSVESPLSVNGF